MGISMLSLRFHLKGVKIARNVTKFVVYTYLFKWVPKSTFKFQFWKSRQKCIFSTLVWPSLIKGQNSSKPHKNRCQCLYLKWVSKSTLKLEFEKLEIMQHFRPWFDKSWSMSKMARNRKNIYMYALSTKWIHKYSFKFQFQECQEKCIS